MKKYIYIATLLFALIGCAENTPRELGNNGKPWTLVVYQNGVVIDRVPNVIRTEIFEWDHDFMRIYYANGKQEVMDLRRVYVKDEGKEVQGYDH